MAEQIRPKRQTFGRMAHHPEMIESQSGVFAEMLVIQDLLRCGFYVCAPVGPHCPFDLVICRAGEDTLFRIEVASGYWAADGVLPTKKSKSYRFDYLAMVMPNDAIAYFRGRTAQRVCPEEFGREIDIDTGITIQSA